jgi:enoyl-CoA hydratase/carnithine racemase
MSATPATDELLFTTDEAGIARIVLNRPQARNALTFAMYQGLITCCEAIADNPAVKALIITGAGDKAFAAGTDIAQFREFKTAEDALGYERFMDRVLGSLERLRVPTIAAIAGACTGGGAAIAAACDLRIATRDARFGFPIARTLGNCLSQGNLKRLSGLIGQARVKDIIFTARLVGAEEALAIGLVSEVVEDRTALTARVDALAQLLAGHAPLTMQATKEGLRRLAEEEAPAEGEAHPGDDLILMCYMSQDFREGMEAFLGKRPPDWTGR